MKVKNNNAQGSNKEDYTTTPQRERERDDLSKQTQLAKGSPFIFGGQLEDFTTPFAQLLLVTSERMGGGLLRVLLSLFALV